MRMVRCGVVLLVTAGAACGGGTAKPDGGGGAGGGGADGGDPNRWTGNVSASINRNVDVLFLIDDSSSMRLLQDKLVQSFPAFITRLQDPPGLPNIHIAVVSQDMGAGDGSISSCDGSHGKNGIFQYTARGTCTSTGLQTGATFIADVGGTRNYTGNLADVFTCIAALGETGCGFEHQFSAILRALGADGQAPPPENEGFLRPDAYLAIVMLTNEDDCSELPGKPFFEVFTNNNVASQLGPPINFRCNEFGHLCDNGSGNKAPPGRLAPNNDVNSMVSYASCVSNETGQNLRTVADTASRIKALKADASQVAVMSIQGPTVPYTVTWKAPFASEGDTSCGAPSCPWPAIAHSCAAADNSFADPGIRTSEFVSAFGDNGLVLPICSDSLGPSMDRAAQLINGLLGPPCIPGLVGMNPATGKPDCKVTERTRSATGMTTTKTVPACADNGNVAPCWSLGAQSSTCLGTVLSVSVDPSLPASTEASLTYDCAKDTTF